MSSELPPPGWDEIADTVPVSCMHCGGWKGAIESVETHDTESFGGWELWFCCHSCREAGGECETFVRVPPPNDR